MKNIILLLSTIVLLGCPPSNENTLKEATEIYNRSLEIEKEIQPKLEELIQARNSINIQGRALTAEEIQFTDEVNALAERLDSWHKTLPEIPQSGQQEIADAEKPSASELLAKQKEAHDAIVAIRASLDSLQVPGVGF